MPTTAAPAPPAIHAPAPPSHVVELRQYTLRPGRRDELIALFEREFLESQEAAGIRVLGQFRDRDDPDRFVWLRGFPDMAARREALHAFYDGPLWKAHRDEANATIADSDDVLLLRPSDARGIAVAGDRPAAGAARRAAALVVATIYLLTGPAEAGFPRFFDESVRPLLERTGATPDVVLVSEHAKNDFRLPVREDARAFVWLAAFSGDAAYEAHRAALESSPEWTGVIGPALERRIAAPPTILRLEPTGRSLLGNVAVAAAAPPGYTTRLTGDVHDFDFLEGSWEIANRRLLARGEGSDRWDEFPATSVCHLHLGGVANVDELAFPTKGWSGMTVRTFDLTKRQWSIFWISSRAGRLEPPVVGGFTGDRGEFYGEDEDGGRAVKVRFVWQRTGPGAARWEQAFSYGGGAWETNWVMELRRKGSGAETR